MGEYIGVFWALVAGVFLLYLWWRDPYRKRANKIMGDCRRRTDTFNILQGKHCNQPDSVHHVKHLV